MIRMGFHRISEQSLGFRDSITNLGFLKNASELELKRSESRIISHDVTVVFRRRRNL